MRFEKQVLSVFRTSRTSPNFKPKFKEYKLLIIQYYEFQEVQKPKPRRCERERCKGSEKDSTPFLYKKLSLPVKALEFRNSHDNETLGLSEVRHEFHRNSLGAGQ